MKKREQSIKRLSFEIDRGIARDFSSIVRRLEGSMTEVIKTMMVQYIILNESLINVIFTEEDEEYKKLYNVIKKYYGPKEE